MISIQYDVDVSRPSVVGAYWQSNQSRNGVPLLIVLLDKLPRNPSSLECIRIHLLFAVTVLSLMMDRICPIEYTTCDPFARHCTYQKCILVGGSSELMYHTICQYSRYSDLIATYSFLIGGLFS